ncbi:MAG: efflux RND transporter permease subunit [Prevotella sp.]|jgi:hydrophobe/amphiphile efflux-1 (HAE1) family protein|nr:efflux RND transporter permease subunit [Prevotella sp.]MCI1282684.1 efflux RND transporter permease subunit [Prevotella sp.]
MNIKTFLNRPILSCVISVLIVMVGIIGLSNLPMEQYPDIAPPTVMVSTTYTGANANAVLKSVVVPLEDAINGVENMSYMTSSATNTGSGSITVTFEQGTDPDMALINVKNRVSQAEGKLPQEVTKIGVTVEKRQNSTLKIMSLYSPSDKFDRDFITNYFKINIEPKLLRIKGVGGVELMGSEYAMRIWLDPQKMAQYGLEPSDVISALGTQNIEAATGTLGEDSKNTFQYTLKYKGRLQKSTDFDNIVIKSLSDGSVLHLKDVAKTKLGTTSYSVEANVNSHNGVTVLISQTAGSNAHEINQKIDKLSKELKSSLPNDLVISNLMDTNDFLNASIGEVVKTLLETILLVILVVYIFLQSARSTIIPTISIIVSLIGTFAFMYLVGFSLNLLTLFALVLVIGTVVDDAIVVVEAVQSKFDEGYRSPYTAAMKAMGGISTAIVTTSLVFMAVFIPTSFMGGTSGTYYQQFGLTMAVAVGISAINALTLCPALCSLLMTPPQIVENGKKVSFSTRFNKAFNTSFHTLVLRYKNGLKHLFKHRWIAWSLLGLTGILLVVLMNTTKTGLIPDEDTGTIFINVSTPAGSTLEQTKKSMDRVTKAIKGIPEIDGNSAITGYSMLGGQMTNGGMIIVKLKNWDERKGKGQDINSVIGKVMVLTKDIKSASIFAFAQPTIMGYSTSNGVGLYVQDHEGGTTEKLMANTNAFIAALQKRPEISQAYTTYSISYPQYIVDVDAAQCMRYGISPTNVLDVLNGYIGGNYASNFNAFSKLYRVMVQASPDKRLDKDALDNMYVKTSSGEMAPVGQFIKLTKTYGPQSLTRFNLYNSISVNAMPATGYSTGDVIKAISEVSKNTLPKGYGYEYTGMTREESNSSSNTVMIFAICIVFIYLILCALYESLFIPLAVMLSVPFGLLGSFIFANIFGLSNNVYMQVGLIMLIGLLSKTSILLTEYASDRRKQGMTIIAAAMSAAGVRLRPILMTALCMTIGMLPLALSTGAGANGDMSLALGVIGGMTVGTISLLFMVPVFFIAFQTLQEKLMPARNHEEEILEEKK